MKKGDALKHAQRERDVYKYKASNVNPFYQKICDYNELVVEALESMAGNEYQRLAGRTINPDLGDESNMMHALHGMVGEIGEIHSLYQKFYQGHDIDEEHLQREVGDLLWFIAEFCTSLKWNLEDVMRMNIDKLKVRYPEGFKTEKSLYRAEGDT